VQHADRLRYFFLGELCKQTKESQSGKAKKRIKNKKNKK